MRFLPTREPAGPLLDFQFEYNMSRTLEQVHRTLRDNYSAWVAAWERGYRATSVDDLVRATGVKPSSLYSAFPGGKHGLLMGSLDRYSRRVVPQKLGDHLGRRLAALFCA
jgi:Bacterial regulatory proteins, tetR family